MFGVVVLKTGLVFVRQMAAVWIVIWCANFTSQTGVVEQLKVINNTSWQK